MDYRGTSKMPVIPDTVKVIGASAFWRSDITGVTIPSSVKLIGASAFYECASLTSVDIPGSVERIDNNAFCDCTGMTSVKLNKGLKVIGEGGFNDCDGLTSLVLPEGLTTLEERAFYDCENIERFTFPKSLTDMEDSSIYTSKWYEGLADGTELYCGSVFLGCKGEKYPSKLTVRPGTKMVRIEQDNLDGVNELILPDGLESLSITEGGGSIAKLTVPESVHYINLRKFAHLTDLKLPTTAVLEESCFSGCYQIKNLTIPKGNTTLKGLSVGRTAHVVLPDDVLEVRGPISNGDPYNNKDGNSNLKSIDLKNVRILTGGALSDCVALESVTLPDSLIALGDGVFSGCARLRSIKGGKNVRQIGDGCFSGCAALTDFGELEKNVTHVGSWAFQNCGWFHDQPNGVVYFGKAAYAYKGSMAEGTVLSLRDGTVSVTYEFLAGQIELNPTFDQPNLAGLILPQSCKYVDDYAFAGTRRYRQEHHLLRCVHRPRRRAVHRQGGIQQQRLREHRPAGFRALCRKQRLLRAVYQGNSSERRPARAGRGRVLHLWQGQGRYHPCQRRLHWLSGVRILPGRPGESVWRSDEDRRLRHPRHDRDGCADLRRGQ